MANAIFMLNRMIIKISRLVILPYKSIGMSEGQELRMMDILSKMLGNFGENIKIIYNPLLPMPRDSKESTRI